MSDDGLIVDLNPYFDLDESAMAWAFWGVASTEPDASTVKFNGAVPCKECGALVLYDAAYSALERHVRWHQRLAFRGLV